MKYIFILLLLFNLSLQAQMNPGPRAAALGTAGTALREAWSLQQNPAGICGVTGPVLSLGYEQYFPDMGLSTRSALFVFPFSRNAVGLSFERYGFSAYQEQNTGIAYAKRFGPSLSLAAGFRYHQLSIPGYGSAGAFSVEVGFQYAVTEYFTLASHVYNPGRSSYSGASGTDIPVKIAFGSTLRFSDKLLLASEIRASLDYPLDAALGLEYSMIGWFALRGGLAANPFKQYGGFGIRYDHISLDGAVSFHPRLGYSPQIALSYEF